MEQDALALLHAHRLAVPQHPAVDREIAISHLKAVRHAFRERRLHRGFACGFEVLDARRGSEEIHVHVAALAEHWLKFLEREKNFTIEPSWLALRFDVDWPNLAAVLPGVQIGPGTIVRVIKTQAGRARREG